MKYTTSLNSVISRGAFCLIILFLLFIKYGPLANAEAETLNFIFLALTAIITVPVTMIICLIVGLPIRLIPKAYRFWMKYPFIAFIGIVTGICILILAFHSPFSTPKTILFGENKTLVNIPNEGLFNISWFSIAFFLLHFYPIAFLNFVFAKFKSRKNIDWDEEIKN